jgi:hypothetical protein
MRVGLLPLVVLLSACESCERSACDAFGEPASAPISQGVAGVVAYETDLIENGCQACEFSTARLRIWQTPQLVTNRAEADALIATSALVDLNADSSYEQELEIGSHLLCLAQLDAQAPCVSFVVVAERVTTVNVRVINGPRSLLVFDANSTQARETSDFSAPPAP